MRDQLLTYLRMVPAASAEMMAQELDLPQPEVQTTLHQMDDDGDLLMRNGWYRLSEKKRAGET